ncbi:MAG: hypothetical protein LBO75_02225 [Bifidobacteriaceae bacterium]|nr:hypothetical protein [Bifidobacteriaceae bacterium]
MADSLAAFGGVLIEGPKWCGKTWTARHQAQAFIKADRRDVQQQAELVPVFM